MTMPAESVKIMADLGYPAYILIILGVAKILGGIAILQPKYDTIKEWAYSGFVIDILGAAASIYFVSKNFAGVMFCLVFLLPIFGSYFLWKKVQGMKKLA